MYNKKAKFLSILCATALVCQGMPVSAEEVSIEEEATQGVSVTAAVEPVYVVTIPKSLTLDKEGVINYTVTASGEIEKLSTLTVTPDESFVLTARYDSATAKVSQEKTSWSDTDLLTDSEKTTTGSITVDGGLAPGDWSGTFNFEIALNEHECSNYVKNDESTHMCEACAATVEHVFAETVEEATCANEGTKTYTCDCGYSYSESLPAAGHTDNNSDEICDECGDECSKSTAGLYNWSGVMTASWDELLEDGTIHVTNGVLKTGSGAETSLVGKLVIDNSVTSLGNNAFESCSSLTNIDIPDSVTNIGDSAFVCCGSLASIDIPSSVTSIGEGTFYSCTSLTSITIPSSVTSIGNEAFDGCSSLTSVVISDGVTSIGNYAFNGCASLTSITISSSVSSIGEGAFRGCYTFTINYKGSEEQWNAVTKGSGWCFSQPPMNYNYTE